MSKLSKFFAAFCLFGGAQSVLQMASGSPDFFPDPATSFAGNQISSEIRNLKDKWEAQKKHASFKDLGAPLQSSYKLHIKGVFLCADCSQDTDALEQSVAMTLKPEETIDFLKKVLFWSSFSEQHRGMVPTDRNANVKPYLNVNSFGPSEFTEKIGSSKKSVFVKSITSLPSDTARQTVVGDAGQTLESYGYGDILPEANAKDRQITYVDVVHESEPSLAASLNTYRDARNTAPARLSAALGFELGRRDDEDATRYKDGEVGSLYIFFSLERDESDVDPQFQSVVKQLSDQVADVTKEVKDALAAKGAPTSATGKKASESGASSSTAGLYVTLCVPVMLLAGLLF